jgi:hypothetical protein
MILTDRSIAMKKFLLSLGLILMLVSWGGQGDQGIGTAPAGAQSPPGSYCDPNYYNCTYDNYYSAPYADPPTQFFYYTVPRTGERIRDRHERRELRREERRERRLERH